MSSLLWYHAVLLLVVLTHSIVLNLSLQHGLLNMKKVTALSKNCRREKIYSSATWNVFTVLIRSTELGEIDVWVMRSHLFVYKLLTMQWSAVFCESVCWPHGGRVWIHDPDARSSSSHPTSSSLRVTYTASRPCSSEFIWLETARYCEQRQRSGLRWIMLGV